MYIYQNFKNTNANYNQIYDEYFTTVAMLEFVIILKIMIRLAIKFRILF